MQNFGRLGWEVNHCICLGLDMGKYEAMSARDKNTPIRIGVVATGVL